MYTHFTFALLLNFWRQYVAEGEAATTNFKLSDLPVLKKWEIPTHQFAKYVGRKYKDLDREIKRSAYWELKPDFTTKELEWDEDPEKIKLDFNYKNFLEDDEEHNVERSLVSGETQIESKPMRDVTGDKRSVLRHVQVANKTSVSKYKHKKHFKKHPKETQKHKVSRRSIDVTDPVPTLNENVVRESWQENNHDIFLNDERLKRSLVEGRNGEEDLFFPNRFFMDNIEDDRVDNEIRGRREAIWDVVRRLQSSQGSYENNKKIANKQNVRRQLAQENMLFKRQPKRQGIQYPTPLISHKIPNSLLPNILFKRSHIVTHEADLKVQKIGGPGHKTSGELGDEQAKRNKLKQTDRSKSARQNISRPDSNVIDPANVARAVTMAMEQLKRDKMWGKVFIHVKPSGQLKVMVQETKKMDEK